MPHPRPILRYSQLPLIRVGVNPVFEFLPDGTLHALRADNILLNLVLGCPVGGSLHCIALSVLENGTRRAVVLAGERSRATFVADEHAAQWTGEEGSLSTSAILTPFDGGWVLDVSVTNRGSNAMEIQAVHGLDLSLTTQFAARLNESYTSQYIDHRALPDSRLGHAIASRQNLAVDGKSPWLIQAWIEGTDAYVTDASQFFGYAGLRGEVAMAILNPPTNSRVKQDETAYAGLFSAPLKLAPGESGARRFVARYRADHPAASDPSDLADLHEIVRSLPPATRPSAQQENDTRPRHCTVHGNPVDRAELKKWFPEDWTAIESLDDGSIASFFYGHARRHVVTRAKEQSVLRPHALILRSGSSVGSLNDLLDTTCHMNGVFQSLLSVGHPSFHRLLSPVRERFGLLGGSGQRIGIRADHGIEWLGIPSAFVMTLTSCEWIYQLANHRIRVSVEVSTGDAESTTTLSIEEGGPLEFIITHGLVGGEREGEEDATVAAQLPVAKVQAGTESLARQHFPDAHFLVEALDPKAFKHVGGSELLGFEHEATAHLVYETAPAQSFGLRLSGYTRSYVSSSKSTPVWQAANRSLRVHAPGLPEAEALDAILPWFIHNGIIHYSDPHGLEQWNGGAWGVRDVSQGAVELLLALDRPDAVRETLLAVFRHQYLNSGDWPQWFMLDPFGWIQQRHMHGDIPLWPLKALCDYLENTSDFAILDEAIDWTNADDSRPANKPSSLLDHITGAVAWMRRQCFPGTALLRYGDGDWDDSLQPARPELREHMVSTWTVALSYQVLRRLEEVQLRSGREIAGLTGFADEVYADFHRWLLPDGIASGFFVFDEDGKSGHPLLHPLDDETGIHYRLLPMKRAIIAGLFSKEQADQHLAIIREHLLAADGARLMDRPAPYRGGPREIFERAESSAAFAREIGVFYTHAHLRYLEMLSILGERDALWKGLQQINPVELTRSVPHALPRQANLYFSSSDAAVHDRYEAAERYDEIVAGKIPVAGGWRLYSSGPGIFCFLVRSRVLGLRKHFDQIHLDPILPDIANGLEANLIWEGKPLKVVFHRGSPAVRLNGTSLPTTAVPNLYRSGGFSIDATLFSSLLNSDRNLLEIKSP
jgi:cellobiose phosphorylase